MNYREQYEREFRASLFPVPVPEPKQRRESLFGDRDLTLAEVSALIMVGRKSIRKIPKAWKVA